MRYFFFSLIVAGWLLAGCSGSKDTADSEPAAEEEPIAEEEQAAEEEEPPAVAVSPIVGDWEGPLANPDGSTLQVVFHITQDNAGNLTATFDSPDQDAFGVPLDEVRFENGELYLYLKVIGGSYTGALQEGNETIEGTWTQPAGSLALNMERVEN
ncbi:MAG: hypothetical protein IH820_06355 [Bacteroidetes bacterium]|nr:hypothetical protein [Bacteroidota bacterium]